MIGTGLKIYINEINTCPGSLSFYLWEPKGKKYRELLDEMIKIGIKDIYLILLSLTITSFVFV